MTSRLTHNRTKRSALLALAMLVAGAFALVVGAGAAFAGGDACGCDSDDEQAHTSHCDADDQARAEYEQVDADCEHDCGGDDCLCTIERRDDDVSDSQALVLTDSTVSFGAPVAAHTNVQIELPEPRAPGRLVAHGALVDSPPSHPLYLENRILLL